jgi:hypothetical protein
LSLLRAVPGKMTPDVCDWLIFNANRAWHLNTSMKMQTSFIAGVLLFVPNLKGNDGSQLSIEDKTYLKHSLVVPIPGEIGRPDQLICFDADVTGDGLAELFYTRGSFRDGKQGYIWSIYQRNNSGSFLLLGEVTFIETVFSPHLWKRNEDVYGFYTFGPSGAGKGRLKFYRIDNGSVIQLESREIAPNGKDEEEFDTLFETPAGSKVPAIELRRSTISE